MCPLLHKQSDCSCFIAIMFTVCLIFVFLRMNVSSSVASSPGTLVTDEDFSKLCSPDKQNSECCKNGRLNESIALEAAAAADHYFNRRFFKLTHKEISYTSSSNQSITDKSGRVNRCFSRREQSLRFYTPRDVAKCMDVLSLRRNRRPMHIAFIGDSTVHQNFVSFLRV